MPSSLYELLEVEPVATFEDIEHAYRRMCEYLDAQSLAVYSMLHDEEAEALRRDVETAYRTLSDPEKRAAYDQACQNPEQGYPAVVIPETVSGSNVSMGHVAQRISHEHQEENVVANEAQPKKPLVNETAIDAAMPQKEEEGEFSPSQSVVEKTKKSHKEHSKQSTGARIQKFVPTLELGPAEEIEFGGSLLKRLRESAGVSLKDLSEVTKISKHYLRAIEENEFGMLPAAVYVRGFIMEYARAFGFNPTVVAKSYLALYQRYKGDRG